MANIFSRSWHITKLSFKVIGQDKELLLFPLFSGIFSVLFMIAMLFPTIITSFLQNSQVGQGLMLSMLFLTYFGLAFIATFFNVCVVYTTKKRFEGGNATFFESLKFAFSRLGLIIRWSLVSATVGVILRILNGIAEKMGSAGELVMKIIISIVGMAWTIVTLFVVPGLVYYNFGPMKAIKKSANVLKKTWGESLIRYYGLGLIQFLITVLGIVILGAVFFFSISLGLVAMIISGLMMLIFLVLSVLVFSIANNVFNTALFVYADSGKVPSGFDKHVLSNAFIKKKR